MIHHDDDRLGMLSEPIKISYILPNHSLPNYNLTYITVGPLRTIEVYKSTCLLLRCIIRYHRVPSCPTKAKKKSRKVIDS